MILKMDDAFYDVLECDTKFQPCSALSCACKCIKSFHRLVALISKNHLVTLVLHPQNFWTMIACIADQS